MTLSEALEKIGKAYLPGVRDFYYRMKPDRWQLAHDQLEGQMMLHAGKDGFDKLMSHPIQSFYTECISLIELAKPLLSPEQLTLSDAFHIGDELRLADLDSLMTNSCRICGSKEQVAVSSGDGFKAGLYCMSCNPNLGRRS
jgi:hypothetical protein